MTPIFTEALKVYNKSQVRWTIPKRNTADYNKVMEIIKNLNNRILKMTNNYKK